MKGLLRTFLFSLFAIFVTQSFISGFQVVGDWQIYLISAAALTFILFFVKPLLKLFFLPINLLSLGLLGWLVNVAVLYLLTLAVWQIKISAWDFPGFSYQGVIVPAYHFSPIPVFIIISFTISFIINFLNWLTK